MNTNPLYATTILQNRPGFPQSVLGDVGIPPGKGISSEKMIIRSNLVGIQFSHQGNYITLRRELRPGNIPSLVIASPDANQKVKVFTDIDAVTTVKNLESRVLAPNTSNVSESLNITLPIPNPKRLENLLPFVQGSTNKIAGSKFMFFYPYNPDIPNTIKFDFSSYYNLTNLSNLIFFIRNVDGTVDLMTEFGVTASLNPDRILTIAGIPVVNDECNAMLMIS